MDAEVARARLLNLRLETEADIEALDRSRSDIVSAADSSNIDDEHDPEGATIAYERAMIEALGGQSQRHLADIDAALERISSQTYGLCAMCGIPIPDARLEARPTADRCLRHA